MGDRVLMQVVCGDKFSPIAYGHWSGSDAPKILARLRERMVGRGGDCSYTFARLVQEMTDGDDGNLSFGVWNSCAVMTETYSHGDAGVVVIDVSGGGFKCKCMGGYLVDGPDGMPIPMA